MIASVRGTVLAIGEGRVVIEVGGVGLSVAVTPADARAVRMGAEAMLHTTLIVREDELSLYGFGSREELEIFDLLRSVSGVGPKSALGVLAAMTPSAIAAAVAAEDDAPFRKVSGIGPKTAKLIAVSLAGKLTAPLPHEASAAPVATAVSDSVVTALIGLGWPERVAAQAVADLTSEAAPDQDGPDTVQSLLRRALARLGPSAAGARS